jgi:hypothetical protein
MDVMHLVDEQPPLTATMCAICHEEQLFHVVTACCKPDAPTGHEPLVCFPCFQSIVRTTHQSLVTCPLCRAVVRHFRKVLAADLRDNTVVLEMQEPVHRLQEAPLGGNEGTTNDARVVVVDVPPVDAPPAARRVSRPTQPRTTLSLFQQHFVDRESLANDVVFADSLRRVEGTVLAEAYRGFLRQRVYQRLAWQRHHGPSVCSILLPELLRSPAHLVDDNGLCVSCLFPIHFHARRS